MATIDQTALEPLPVPDKVEELEVEAIEVSTKTDYDHMNVLIKKVKEDWDSEAINELLHMFKPLIQYIEERLYQYFGWSGTREDIESHFLELVYEYDRYFKNDYKEKYDGKEHPKSFYFPYYIKSKLWFRVSEYLKSFNEPVLNTVRCKICDGRMISINQSHLNSRKCRFKQKQKNIVVNSIQRYESLYGRATYSERPGRSTNCNLSYTHHWDFNFKAQEYIKRVKENLSDKHSDIFMCYFLMDFTQKEIAEIYKERRTNVSTMLKEIKTYFESN